MAGPVVGRGFGRRNALHHGAGHNPASARPLPRPFDAEPQVRPGSAARKRLPIVLDPFQIGASASDELDGDLACMDGDEARQGE